MPIDQTSNKISNRLITTKVIDRLEHIEQATWDHCIGEAGSPFLCYNFLLGLEICGCVGQQSGWIPRYVIAEVDSEVVGVTPAYIKYHSQGEFIFDWSWADAAHRAGMSYYPKLVVTSPFSPVGSEKLLCAPKEDQEMIKSIRLALLDALETLAQKEGLTGVHLLFTSESEAELLESKGLLRRHTLQFQWNNENYQCFDDFMSRFRSKRRNQIKRERRSVRQAGIEVNAYCGSDIKPEHLPIIYKLYKTTVEKYFYGNLYLNYAFFQFLYETEKDRLCLLLAEKEGEVIGGSFNMLSNGVLYGRYWGVYSTEQIKYLHFEVCAYRGIELCIERGWSRFEAGSGGGSHKYGRGFLPRLIYSSHQVNLPGFQTALTEILACERQQIDLELQGIEGDILKV